MLTITQGEAAWLELGPFEDAAFYLDVREVTGTVTLTYQTGPSKDDVSFQTLLPPVSLAVGQRVDAVRARFAFAPIGRFVRWQIVGAGTYDATFVIELAAH